MRRLASLVVVLATLAAACADDTTTTPTTTTTTAVTSTTAAPTATTVGSTTTTAAPSTTVEAAGFPLEVLGVEISERPDRILSASGTHTEILFAIGAGEQVFATDQFSDFPAEARETEKIDAFNINVEAVAALDPDLVVLAFDPGDVVAGLDALGVPTLLFDAPATLDDAYQQMLDLGVATGNGGEAETLVESMQKAIAETVGNVPVPEQPFTYYHELDSTGFSVTSDSFIGSVYRMLGLVSIADAADSAFPQLSTEFIVEADPDWIFLADTVCCGESAQSLASRPGWDQLTAIAEGNVVELDDSVASRWGPRLVEFVDTVATAVYGPST